MSQIVVGTVLEHVSGRQMVVVNTLDDKYICAPLITDDPTAEPTFPKKDWKGWNTSYEMWDYVHNPSQSEFIPTNEVIDVPDYVVDHVGDLMELREDFYTPEHFEIERQILSGKRKITKEELLRKIRKTKKILNDPDLFDDGSEVEIWEDLVGYVSSYIGDKDIHEELEHLRPFP